MHELWLYVTHKISNEMDDVIYSVQPDTLQKDSCIGSFISVPKLEKAVIDEINKLSAEYLNKDELIENVQFNNNLREQQEEVNMEIVAYQKNDF